MKFLGRNDVMFPQSKHLFAKIPSSSTPKARRGRWGWKSHPVSDELTRTPIRKVDDSPKSGWGPLERTLTLCKPRCKKCQAVPPGFEAKTLPLHHGVAPVHRGTRMPSSPTYSQTCTCSLGECQGQGTWTSWKPIFGKLASTNSCSGV